MKKRHFIPLFTFVALTLALVASCSLGTKQWTSVSFAVEVPASVLGSPGTEDGTSGRYIAPNATKLTVELWEDSHEEQTSDSDNEYFHYSNTITLSSGQKSVTINIPKVPLNTPLYGYVYVEDDQKMSIGGNSVFIENGITSATKRIEIGIVPSSDQYKTASFNYFSEDSTIKFQNSESDEHQLWGITMCEKPGLYILYLSTPSGQEETADYPNVRIYKPNGTPDNNAIEINGYNNEHSLIFYHPNEEEHWTYTFYLAGETLDDLIIPWDGEKIDDIVVTESYKEEEATCHVIKPSGDSVFLDINTSQDQTDATSTFYIHNPYPFTLRPSYNIEKYEGQSGEFDDFAEYFTVNSFPSAIEPGESKGFTITFTEPSGENAPTYCLVTFTISADNLDPLSLTLYGYVS